MGAVESRSLVTVEMCKASLKVENSEEDDFIALLLKAAKEDADTYMGNDFLDSDGNELEIPGFVERWILRQVSRDYENRADGLQNEAVNQLGTISWLPKRDYSDLFPKWKPRI